MQLGLSPKEFWKLNFKELRFYAEAYEWRKDEWAELQAHFTAQSMNVHLKRSRNIKGRDLYRRMNDETEFDKAEHDKRFQEAVSLMGPDAIPVNR